MAKSRITFREGVIELFELLEVNILSGSGALVFLTSKKMDVCCATTVPRMTKKRFSVDLKFCVVISNG